MLTNSQLQQYYDDGFIHLKSFFSHDQVGVLRSYSVSFFNKEATITAPFLYHHTSELDGHKLIPIRLEKFLEDHQEVEKVLSEPRYLDVISQILGDKASLFKDKIIFKIPGAQGFKPHQDFNYGWKYFAKTYTNALVAIDDADELNGGIELAKGGHRNGILDPEWELMSDENAAKFNFVLTPLKSGDLLLFDSQLPHQSSPNLSDKSRIMMYLTYNPLSEGEFREKYFQLIPKIRRKFLLLQLEKNLKNKVSKY